MKQAWYVKTIFFLIFCLIAQAKTAVNTHLEFTQKIAELKDMLNRNASKLTQPDFLPKFLNLLRIVLTLGTFTVVGYKAYQKTFGEPSQRKKDTIKKLSIPNSTLVATKKLETVEVPIQDSALDKREAFFYKIKNMPSSAINYLDAVIPMLEQNYALQAQKVNKEGYSLIGAAIIAPRLDSFNKQELISWLKNYGVIPTQVDKQAAAHTADNLVIQAVLGD